MKSASAQMITYLEDTCATLSVCLKLTAIDNTVIGFTNYTRDIDFEGVIYRASSGQTPSAIESSSSLSVDNLDVDTVRDPQGILGIDVLNAKWDLADGRLFLINPNDKTAGVVKLRRSTVGKISLARTQITAEMRGMMEHLTKQALDLYSPGCRVDLGSAKCQIRLDPPSWAATTVFTERTAFAGESGSVVKPLSDNNRHFVCTTPGTSGASEPSWNLTIGGTTVDGSVTWTTIQALTSIGTVTAISTAVKRVFRDSSRTEPDDFYQGGLLTVTSGQNSGRAMEVKKYTLATGEFELVLPLAFPIGLSDTYNVTAGCSKRIVEDCRGKFDNTHNFQAESYVQQNFRISPARIEQNAGGK